MLPWADPNHDIKADLRAFEKQCVEDYASGKFPINPPIVIPQWFDKRLRLKFGENAPTEFNYVAAPLPD